jgi:hypothetical protein
MLNTETVVIRHDAYSNHRDWLRLVWISNGHHRRDLLAKGERGVVGTRGSFDFRCSRTIYSQ